MSKITEQINTLLSDDALSHSLSKEALERMLAEIKTLNDDCYKLNKDLEATNKALEINKKELDETRCESYDNRRKNEKWQEREQELLAREKACIRTEIENEFAVKRGNEHHNLILTVFKNRGFRESVTSSFPVKEKTTYDNNNMMRESEYHNDVTSTETKEVSEE